MTHRFSWWIFLLCIGIVIRVLSISYALSYRENTDILRWKDWGRISYLYSLKDTYKPDYLTFGTLPNNMPPGTLYIASEMYRLNILASKLVLRISHQDPGSNMFLNAILPTIFLRLPSLFFDGLIACLIYVFLKKRRGEILAVVSSMLFFFKPHSTVQQRDLGSDGFDHHRDVSLVILFLYKKHFTLALTTAIFSLFVKVSLVFLLPVIIVSIYGLSKSLTDTLKSIAVAFALMLLAILPVSLSPFVWLLGISHKTSQEKCKISPPLPLTSGGFFLLRCYP